MVPRTLSQPCVCSSPSQPEPCKDAQLLLAKEEVWSTRKEIGSSAAARGGPGTWDAEKPGHADRVCEDGEGEPLWEWSHGDGSTACTHSPAHAAPRACSLSPEPDTGESWSRRLCLVAIWHADTEGVQWEPCSLPQVLPDAPLLRPVSGAFPGPFLPFALAPRWTSPSENRSSRSSIAAQSGEGASTGLKHHCPRNPPALSGFPCHREAHLPLCPLPCQRSPPASSAQPPGLSFPLRLCHSLASRFSPCFP